MTSKNLSPFISSLIAIVSGGLIIGAFWRWWDSVKSFDLPGNIVIVFSLIIVLMLIRFISFPTLISKLIGKTGETINISIDGKWKTSFRESGRTFHENVDLKQTGNAVKGTIELIDPDDPDENSTYKFSGKFSHRILAGMYESEDPEDYEQGSFVLEYKKKGLFVGMHLFFSREDQRIDASPYKWKRPNQK